MSVRIGVIGVGYLGQHHARIYSELNDAELVAVADIDCARAEEIAKRFGCGSSSRYAEVIEASDAISIVTPTTTHYEIAMACLRAGKDILIEKPITEDIGLARSVVEEAERKGVILQVGHLERFNPAVAAASRMIREPRFIEAERLSPFLGRAVDVDVTVDLMIHDIDIVMSIVRSKLLNVRAAGGSVVTDKIDVAKAWLEFENGCTALLTASRLAPEKQRRMKICQDDAYISIDFQTQEVRRYFKAGHEISVDVVRPENKEPLKEELTDFIHCVKHRRTPRVTGGAAVDALDVAQRITTLLRGEKKP